MLAAGVILFLVWWMAMVCSYPVRAYVHLLLPVSIYLLL